MATIPADGYRINAGGIDLLRPGGDVLNPLDWYKVVAFAWDDLSNVAIAQIGPNDAPVEISKTAAGSPKINLIDPNGQALPMLRSTSGTVVVTTPTKDVRINFGVQFQVTPRVAVFLTTQVTSQPYRVTITPTYCDVKFANNFGAADGLQAIDWVATEPA